MFKLLSDDPIDSAKISVRSKTPSSSSSIMIQKSKTPNLVKTKA